MTKLEREKRATDARSLGRDAWERLFDETIAGLTFAVDGARLDQFAEPGQGLLMFTARDGDAAGPFQFGVTMDVIRDDRFLQPTGVEGFQQRQQVFVKRVGGPFNTLDRKNGRRWRKQPVPACKDDTCAAQADRTSDNRYLYFFIDSGLAFNYTARFHFKWSELKPI